jgi:hypothetical protein
MKTPQPIKFPGDRTLSRSGGGKKAKRSRDENLPPPKIPKGLRFADPGDTLQYDNEDFMVVGALEDVEFDELPSQPGFVGEPPEGGNLFTVGNTFSGYVQLPPRSNKRNESAGDFKQFFLVLQCQPGALTVTMADTTWKLSEKMAFFVPKDVEYSLNNYSESVPAQLGYVLVKETDLVQESPKIKRAKTVAAKSSSSSSSAIM